MKKKIKFEDWLYEKHEPFYDTYLSICIPFWKLADGSREIKRGLQRMFRGYDDTARWSLYDYLLPIIIPNLKHLKKNSIGYPSKLTPKEWKQILQEMITAFEIMQRDNDKELIKKDKQIQKGLLLFAKHFRSLWD